MSEVLIEKEAFDELKQSVASLTQHVEGLKDGKVDEETVAKIVEDVIEKQKVADAPANRRRSFDLGDDETESAAAAKILGQGSKRLYEIQSRPAGKVAAITRLSEGEVRAFQQAADGVAILGAIIEARKADNELGNLPSRVQDTTFWVEEFLPLAQAMDTATTAEGLEFVPKALSANLIERVNLQLRVAALFPFIEMPTNPFDIPGRGVARIRLGQHAEQTADTGQTKFKAVTPATRKITLSAKKFAGEALVSKEAEEDAIIAMLPFIQEELIDYMAADLEDAIVNGDTAGAQDTGWAADDPRKNFDGLRKTAQAGAKTDVANAAPTVANSIRATRKKMGKYAVSPSDIVHLCSISAYIQLLADTNLYTVDKYGQGATIIAGELGRVDGSPLLVSEYVQQNLNATGVFDNTTTNRTEIVSVYPRGYVLGNRRGLTVSVLRELYAESDQDAIIASHRKAFAGRFPTSELVVGVAYNIAS